MSSRNVEFFLDLVTLSYDPRALMNLEIFCYISNIIVTTEELWMLLNWEPVVVSAWLWQGPWSPSVASVSWVTVQCWRWHCRITHSQHLLPRTWLTSRGRSLLKSWVSSWGKFSNTKYKLNLFSRFSKAYIQAAREKCQWRHIWREMSSAPSKGYKKVLWFFFHWNMLKRWIHVSNSNYESEEFILLGFLRFVLSSFMCVFSLCVCNSICHMCVGTHRGQKRVLDFLEPELQIGVSLLTRVLGTELRSLHKLCVFFSAEPSLQP